MPGKPFRSSLESHFDEIAQRRARRETWAGIAAELEKSHGLKVHFSAVQKFFGRYRARQSQPLGFEPLPAPTNISAHVDSTDRAQQSTHRASSIESVPESGRDYFGDPVGPDAENPFKMRKKLTQHSPSKNA